MITHLLRKQKECGDVYSLYFEARLDFEPGQYLKYTIGDEYRYFAISSIPGVLTRLTTRFPNPMSEFKKKLFAMQPGDEIEISEPMGSFNVDKQNVLFIAGGAAIAPFRSIILSNRLNATIIAATKDGNVPFYDQLSRHATIIKDTGDKINLDLVKKHAWNTSVYVSGPPEMIEAIRTLGIDFTVNDGK